MTICQKCGQPKDQYELHEANTRLRTELQNIGAMLRTHSDDFEACSLEEIESAVDKALAPATNKECEDQHPESLSEAASNYDDTNANGR